MKTVFVIAGFDPSGGAGVLADVKAIAAQGCFGAAAITSLTFQNTLGVVGAEHVRPETLAAQIDPVLEDIEIHAAKTGMLPTVESVHVTARALGSRRHVPLVVDPVVRSTSGFDLVDDDALDAIRSRLFPLATVVTPNVVEAERLTRASVANEREMEEAARALVHMGAEAALITGGHLDLDGMSVDVLYDGSSVHVFADRRIDSTSTHGTGCTLASTIAAGLALGRPLPEAVAAAKAYVSKAILAAPRIGHGNGPVDHFFFLERP